jgi:Bacterial SH3 domain
MDCFIGTSRFVGQRGLPLLLLLLLTTACALGSASSASSEPNRPIRSPRPTFTPTVAGLAPANSQPPAVNNNSAGAVESNLMPTDTLAPPTPTQAEPVATPTAASAATPVPPRLVVNSPLVNVRTGPGITYNVLTTVERGQEFDIIGKNAAGDWWRFCCVDGQPAWIINELVDIDGAAELAPVSDEVSQAAPAAPPAATQPPAAAPTATEVAAPTEPPPAPALAFDLIASEQFSEPSIVRAFLYVYDGEQALAGYTIQVKKDGAAQAVNGTTFGGQPGFTWPIADTRQRFQNFKAEFPNVAPAGLWEVVLVDGGGNPVGPPATFTLKANEPNQELYVRYKKR